MLWGDDHWGSKVRVQLTCACRSATVTLYPRLASIKAVARPAGPPPTTKASVCAGCELLFGWSVGFSLVVEKVSTVRALLELRAVKLPRRSEEVSVEYVKLDGLCRGQMGLL